MSAQEPMKEMLRVLAALLAKFEQREARMQAIVEQRLQAVHDEVAQLHRRIDGIVSGAQARIVEEAKAAIVPVAAEYGRAVDTASAQLRVAGRTVRAWYGALAGLCLLLVLVAWGVLGYYRRELAEARDALERYEDAVPVLQAFYASDATVCGDRICVNVDASAPRQGDARQYAAARPRRSH
ncbi:hypothetical protein [Luteimonas huabeiensis]|uniref:hypothetical protein n=1 Tax=Luteimonas huabeiensis TaxID=1244513 RepID=UPI0004669B17|nr:hypothetical protein [Luteimonas huabeiensis]